MAGADDFRVALDKSLQKLNREGLQVKDKQYDALRSVVVEKKDKYDDSCIHCCNNDTKIKVCPKITFLV